MFSWMRKSVLSDRAEPIFEILAEIRAQGVTLLLVEQNARKALQVADYAYVLERGKLAHAAPSAELRDDPRIVAAYLGG